jgi:hypothetical protein
MDLHLGVLGIEVLGTLMVAAQFDKGGIDHVLFGQGMGAEPALQAEKPLGSAGHRIAWRLRHGRQQRENGLMVLRQGGEGVAAGCAARHAARLGKKRRQCPAGEKAREGATGKRREST